MSIIPPDGSQSRCWFCREQGHTISTCPYFTLAQQRYCAYQNHVYDESKALTQGASTGSRRVELVRTRIELAISPRRESRESRRELRFSDNKHRRILRRSGKQGDRRQAAKQVFALPPVELRMPAPVLDTTVLLEEDSKSSVHVPTTPRESGKE